MSAINVDTIRSRTGTAPQLDKGVEVVAGDFGGRQDPVGVYAGGGEHVCGLGVTKPGGEGSHHPGGRAGE